MSTPNRGEVWQVRFDPSIGAEITNIRPAVVMSIPEIGVLPLRIVVPITDWKPRYAAFPWFVPLQATAQSGLSKESGSDAFQVKSLSVNRFVRQLGALTPDEVENISAAIGLCIGYST